MNPLSRNPGSAPEIVKLVKWTEIEEPIIILNFKMVEWISLFGVLLSICLCFMGLRSSTFDQNMNYTI